MKVLSIGNSFSQDATRYLHQIAKNSGDDFKTVNLYIGGCTLATHYKNMNNDDRAYSMEYNGETTGFFVSIREALQSDEWDYVTFQQASHKSVDYDSYQPYLNAISEYCRFHSPKAKQIIHQTWAYEDGSAKLCEQMGYASHKDMFMDLSKAYKKAAADINADGIIPAGKLLQNLLANGIEKVHRDTYHASFGVGRYALGLLWYGFFTGNDVLNDTFSAFEEPISDIELEIIRKTTSELLK